ncbi:MAG: oligosaccharide flippase family protein, partial [Tannerellaceae bacterium]
MSIKQQSIKGVIWSFIERFSVQGIQFIIGIIMARLLTPSDFGLVGMLAIFLAIAQSLIDSGFSNALIQKFDRNETDYSTVFYFNIVVGIVLYGVLYLVAPYIADFYNAPALTQLARVIGLNLFINSLAVVQRAKLTIIVDFKTQAKASLIGVFIGGGVGIILAYQGFGVWALAIQSVLSTSLNTLLLWVFSKWIPRSEFSMQSFNRLFSFGSKL